MAHLVEIFGQMYALQADADEEHVRKVADLVDRKMREVAAGSRAVSTLHVAVLAALDLASELVQSRTVSEHLSTEVEARSGEMSRRIDDLITRTDATP